MCGKMRKGEAVGVREIKNVRERSLKRGKGSERNEEETVNEKGNEKGRARVMVIRKEIGEKGKEIQGEEKEVKYAG